MPDAPATDLSFSMPTVERVRAHYASLCAAAAAHFGSGSLPGRLLLIDGLVDEGDALLIAASIAGAASLVLETRTEAVRHCVRNGIVDFAVLTLDEALRILKNEVRKQQPIAVLLERESTGVLAEMIERGAQADMLRWAAAEPAIQTLLERGATLLPGPVDTPSNSRDEVIWRARDGGSAALRQLDLLAAEVVPGKDAARQNWIARSPRYLPRALRLERGIRMNAAEGAAFLAAVKERTEQEALAAPVSVEIDGQVYSLGATAS
jgi:Urocanase Rossmann-like domain